jgi:hypothetical protein
MNRRSAIRKRCIDCSAGSLAEVKDCHHADCPLHPYRTGQGKQNAKARDRAIKRYCLWCNVSRYEVHLCPVTQCTLYPYRKSEAELPSNIHVLSENLPYTANFTTSDDDIIPGEASAHA